MKKLSLLLTTALVCTSLMAQATPTNFNKAQTTQIENIVHNYLVKNPTVLVEASQALQAQQAQQEQQKAINAVKANKQAFFHNPATPAVGASDKKAQAYVVEFFDFQCGHCKALASIMNQVIKDNSGVRVIFKSFPIFGSNSVYAAKATIAGYQVDPAKYLGFHEALMQASNPLSIDAVLKLAAKSGYDTKALIAQMRKDQTTNELDSNVGLAQKIGLNFTPALVIANKSLTKFQFIPGASNLSTLQHAIDQLK